MKRSTANVLLAVAALAFVFGLFQLFKLRFEAGDVYPAYSSLRADPLGTMVLFESLDKMPELHVVRDFSSENHLPDGKGTTYLHLAATRDEWLEMPDETVEVIQGFVLSGGRLVIAFSPETSRPFVASRPSRVSVPGVPKKNVSPLFKERWGVEFGFESLPTGEAGSYEPVSVHRKPDLPLPPAVDWHSGMIFTNVASGWTAVYSRGTNPVVMERRFGAGSVVLLSDTFCLSNEAMANDRQPELMSWLVGAAGLVEFDESHLGVMETSGVAVLMRKYRLHGLIIGVLLLTFLFIWKQSVSFCPHGAESEQKDEVLGKETSAGFINLLRRNVPPRDLLRLCFNEWTKSLSKRGTVSLNRIDQAQAVFQAEMARASSEQDPVKAYRQIRLALLGVEHPDSQMPQSEQPASNHSSF